MGLFLDHISLYGGNFNITTTYVGKFFQLTIVHSDTLRRYIALVLPYKEQQL